MTSVSESGADPRLSANIYCAGHLDRVVAEIIVPLWRSLDAERSAGSVWLWLMRYGKRGEHLKLRLHDPGQTLDLEAIKDRVEQDAARFFASLDPPGEEQPPKVKTMVPPIDVEDREKEPYEDRLLVWTSYQRHRLSLGDAELYGDDRYCELFTRAMAAATGIFLESVEEGGVEGAASRRLVTLFAGVTAALWGLGMDVDRRVSYLAYHRDWLLRFSLTPKEPNVDPALQSRNTFDKKLAAMDPAKRQNLLEKAWYFETEPMTGEVQSFSDRVCELADYAGPIVRGLDRALDPKAEDFFDSVLFKVLQGFSNITGLRVFEEAWVHHLLHVAMQHAPASKGG